MYGVFEIGAGHWKRLWLHLFGFLALLFLITPILIVIPMSFSDSQYLEFPPKGLSLKWYASYFQSAEWMDATWVSIRVSLFTVLLATPIGMAAAYGLNLMPGPWVQTIRSLILVPMVIPVIIIAIGVFYLYAWVGLVNTILGLVLAHTVLAIPFVMIIVMAGLKRFDMNLERAAISLGASRLVAFLTVTLPLLSRSVFAAALIAMITSLDEVVIALFVSLGESSTLTRRMFSFLRDQIDPTIAAISTILICISCLVAVIYGLQATSRSGARLAESP